MNRSRDESNRIAKELAAVDSEITHLREKLRVLHIQRDRLQTAQTVLLELQGEKTASRRSTGGGQAENQKTRGVSRAFHYEGQTAALVRYVYQKGNGCTVVEAAKRTGISTLRTRPAFERLRSSGYMIRSGNEYALTQKGIAAWQESPLFDWDGYHPERQVPVRVVT